MGLGIGLGEGYSLLVMGCWEGDDAMPAVVEDLDTRVGNRGGNIAAIA